MLTPRTHLISASSSAPVDTGLRYQTLSLLSKVLAALHSIVEKMVFPTSVFAPYTWYKRKFLDKKEPIGIFPLIHKSRYKNVTYARLVLFLCHGIRSTPFTYK